ncbi:MAG: lipopolysaccharide biosynthesis protein [Syntrophobacteraceae bacterium]|nr:lipopolysaccharide biosynthesis protein [Syntrophobacteraceae bacterium]
MDDNLKADTINALSWSFLESAVTGVLRFVIGVILARLLFPEQFGLIGMLLIFIAVAQVFVQSGFDAALIQKVDATPVDICSIFYFNIFVGISAWGVLCLAAPWIAAFLNRPVLNPLLRVLSLTIVIDSLGAIQGTLFNKEINFKAITEVSLIAGLLSGIVGITLAVKGFGVWSLVAQQVSLSLFQAIALWVLSPWRPDLIFSFQSLRQMFGFGSRLLFSGILHQIFENIYFLVIGKLFSAGDLGLFTRAKTMQDLPSQTMSTVVGRVTFPVFSQNQSDPARLKRGLKKAVKALVLINFPLMVGLSATAKPLVIVLLGQKWAGCIPFLQLLCAVGLLYPLQVMNLNILTSVGRSDLFLRLEIVKKALTVLNLLIAWRWGILGIIYGMVAMSIISFYLNSYYTRRLIDYSPGEQLKDLLPYLSIAALMGVAVFCIGLFRFHNLLMLLLIQILTGAVVYLGLCRIFRLAAFVEVRRELCDRIPFLRTGSTA